MFIKTLFYNVQFLYLYSLPFTLLYYRNAPTKKEYCESPRKRFVKLNQAPDPTLTSKRRHGICKKSAHPNIHICKKKPNTKFVRKSHRIIKRLLKKIMKKEKQRGKWIKRNNRKERNKNKRFLRKALIIHPKFWI